MSELKLLEFAVFCIGLSLVMHILWHKLGGGK